MTPHSVSEARIPILAAPLGRGVENGPQRIEIGRTARILAGVGGRRPHFAGPEMADAAVAAREHVVAGRIGIGSTDVIARVDRARSKPDGKVRWSRTLNRQAHSRNAHRRR